MYGFTTFYLGEKTDVVSLDFLFLCQHETAFKECLKKQYKCIAYFKSGWRLLVIHNKDEKTWKCSVWLHVMKWYIKRLIETRLKSQNNVTIFHSGEARALGRLSVWQRSIIRFFLKIIYGSWIPLTQMYTVHCASCATCNSYVSSCVWFSTSIISKKQQNILAPYFSQH